MRLANEVVTLGSDPELFVRDKKSRKIVSVIGRLMYDNLPLGGKHNPSPVKELGEGFSIQQDNVLLEFNTPPARDSRQWVSNHSRMLDWIKGYLSKNELNYQCVGSVVMPEEEMQDPRCRVFGCDPSFNVYSLSPSVPSPMGEADNLRSAGGHVHIGIELSPQRKVRLARQLDLSLGVSSVLLDREEKQRRKLYGRAGEIRFKPYGLEYRVLSNFWLRSQEMMGKLANIVYDCVGTFEQRAQYLTPEIQEQVQKAINEYDEGLARQLIASCTWSSHLVNE